MRSINLLVGFLFAFQVSVFGQEDRFMKDISDMKISLSFKDFIVADSYTNPGKLSHSIRSNKVFISLDSSQIFTVRIIHKGGFESKSVKKADQTNRPVPILDAKTIKERKKQQKIAKVFGGENSLLGNLCDKSSSPFPGYSEEWGVVVFGKLGTFVVAIHQREDTRKKMSEKAFINFASNFIRFNN